MHEGSEVGIWIRVSTEDQARGESPEHHLKRAEHYAQAKGWRVVKTYHLEGISGKLSMDHPQAKQMMADIESGKIKALIFSKLARLARNTRHLLDIADFFRQHDADLVSLQESIDTSTPAGRLFYTMIAAMAQWEREEIAERVSASVPIRAKLGKPLGGAAPYGYRWEDKKLVVDEKEAPVRRLMFELFLEHKRKKTIARILNERGYRTRKGALWSDTTMERLLSDPVVIGKRRVNYTKASNEHGKWETKDPSQWIVTESPQIVDDDIFNQVAAILEAQHQSFKKIARKPKSLFTGLIYCGCGGKMYIPSGSYKYVCRKCRSKIPKDDMEAIFHEQLKRFLLSPELIAQYLQGADSQIQEKQEQLQILNDQKADLAAQMDKLYELYMADQISAQGFGEKNFPLERQLNAIDSQIPALEGQIDCLRVDYIATDQSVVDAANLYKMWEGYDLEQKRTVVEALTESITVADGEVSIAMHYSPFLKEYDNKATNHQGFMAAISWKSAGNSA